MNYSEISPDKTHQTFSVTQLVFTFNFRLDSARELFVVCELFLLVIVWADWTLQGAITTDRQ